MLLEESVLRLYVMIVIIVCQLESSSYSLMLSHAFASSIDHIFAREFMTFALFVLTSRSFSFSGSFGFWGEGSCSMRLLNTPASASLSSGSSSSPSSLVGRGPTMMNGFAHHAPRLSSARTSASMPRPVSMGAVGQMTVSTLRGIAVLHLHAMPMSARKASLLRYSSSRATIVAASWQSPMGWPAPSMTRFVLFIPSTHAVPPQCQYQSYAVSYLFILQTITRFDPFIMEVHDGEVLASVTFKLFRADGSTVVFFGPFGLTDNGFHRWRCMMCPISRPTTAEAALWSRWCEALRKDSECCFGILKGISHFAFISYAQH